MHAYNRKFRNLTRACVQSGAAKFPAQRSATLVDPHRSASRPDLRGKVSAPDLSTSTRPLSRAY